MTGRKNNHLPRWGIDRVGCSGCNGYTGDTDCETKLPVLCIRKDIANTPRPPYSMYGECPTCAYADIQFYHGWAGGHLATTPFVKGSKFRNRAHVDAYCAKTFGPRWQVSSIHDGNWIPGMNGTTYADQEWTENIRLIEGGGWDYYAYGNIRNDTRYWFHIFDQPSTCWENELTGRK